MRVAFNTLPDSLVSNLASLNTQQYRLQNQATTGKRISQLEDDPAAMQRVLQAQVEQSQTTQYRSNIAFLQQRANSSFDAMQGLQKIAQRAGEIATSADGTAGPQELQSYAAEVNQLIQQGVQLMNSKYQGAYLFAGARTDQPAFVAVTDANGNVSSVAYQGTRDVPSTEIGPGNMFSVGVIGENSTGSGPLGLITDSRSGADFFNHLLALETNLRNGDTAAISASDAPALAKDEDNIISHLATNGIAQAHLTTADSLAAARSASTDQRISQDSDADLTETLTRLSATQTAFQAALQSGSSLLKQGQTLLDYLR
jgi:flagellar hook-associated protein 3 FlgL